ncbi:MAG: hypothetical protein HUK14_05700 [Muribaculaceae bacterium]|nr:hypothetical protein [Muribaculaceae bacterium]
MRIYSYLAAAILGMTLLTGCSKYAEPPYDNPSATWKPNTTIAELKERYWDDATNYIDTIEVTEAGEHVIISGRVVSSDASGNIYNSLVIQDETGALAISVRRNQIYTDYPVGQEIVMDLTNMYIGKYNGLQQLGFPEWYAKGQAWEATFMSWQLFRTHTQLNGRPEPAKIDTIPCSYAQLGTTAADLRKWQSQLVRFDNVKFADGGKLAFTDGQKVTSNRNLIVDGGETIVVRTSGYSNFWNDLLPEGTGTVVGILSYYGSSGWQLLLRSREDCIGFIDIPGGEGTRENPFTVNQVLTFEQQGVGGLGWVTGYIVGAAAPGVTTITSDDDVEWGADVSMDNTLMIAADPDCRDYTKCLIFQLPQNSVMRKYANIPDHLDNVGRRMALTGNFTKVLGTWGIDGNNGTKDEFYIDGVVIPDDPDPGPGPGPEPEPQPEVKGDGSHDNPYIVASVLTLSNPGTTSWVEGYIVGYVAGNTMSAAVFGIPADRASNIIIADSPAETDPSKCVPVELKTKTDIRAALNLMDNPGVLGSKVMIQGSLQAYMGTHGIKAPKSYEMK